MELNIQFGQIDPDAKADSIPSTTDAQPWVDILELKRDDIVPPNVGTLEHNQFILDGTMDEFPNRPQDYQWGYFSKFMSNAQGILPMPDGVNYPNIDVTFKNIHKGPGITLMFYDFSEDYANLVRVTWYATNLATVLHTDTYEINSVVGIINQPVDDFRRIKIEFLSTNIPFRYIKMFAIEYGVIRTFADTDIDTANLLEEIDPISDIISINTLDFTIRTHVPEFSPVSGDAGSEMLMRRQYLNISADEIPFGTYFLTGWKDKFNDGKVFEFSAIDAIGVMDGYRFMGDVYDNVLASTVLDQLFDMCFPTQLVKYVLDEPLINKRISGLIPIGTARQALQQICFALGVVADDSRRDYVWIYEPDTEITSDIPLDEIYQGGSIEPTQYFSGVDLIAFEYRKITETYEIHNGVLGAGEYTFEFTEPFHTLTITGGAILTSSANYARIRVITYGTVVLNGLKYSESKRTHSVREVVAAGQQENICVFDKGTLVTNAIAPALAADLFRYLKYRLVITNEIRLNDREVGYVAKMATYARPIVGTLERLDIAFRGGRAQSKVVGNLGVD